MGILSSNIAVGIGAAVAATVTLTDTPALASPSTLARC